MLYVLILSFVFTKIEILSNVVITSRLICLIVRASQKRTTTTPVLDNEIPIFAFVAFQRSRGLYRFNILLFRLAMPKIMLLSETAKNKAEIWLYMNGEPTPCLHSLVFILHFLSSTGGQTPCEHRSHRLQDLHAPWTVQCQEERPKGSHDEDRQLHISQTRCSRHPHRR